MIVVKMSGYYPTDDDEDYDEADVENRVAEWSN
jgi:hypothetical protein